MKIKPSLALVPFVLFFSSLAFGEPPFITDDADPADLGLVQTYYFFNFSSISTNTAILGPAIEIDYGIIKDMEFHVILGITANVQHVGGTSIGLGDTEVNIKYRFLHESTYLPEMVIEPTLEIPTGNASRNLGNGRPWGYLPLWAEKHFEKWTVYSGGGYAYNPAPHMDNYFFGGIVFEREVTDKLTIGGEIYSEGDSGNVPTTPFQDLEAFTLINLGVIYNFYPELAINLGLGHTIAGMPQWIGYFGINWNLQT